MRALVDGDIVVYSCGFASDKYLYKVRGCNDLSFEKKKEATEFCLTNGIKLECLYEECIPEPLEYCLHSVKKLLTSIQEATSSDVMTVYLTGEGNYRNEIATLKPYKGNRSSRKPHWYNEIRKYLVDTWKAEVIDGMEADDAMGIEQCKYLIAGDTVIASLDKDMLMIPGLHYNWRKDVVVEMPFMDGLLHFYTQMLTGDTADNIPGVPGIGPVKAKKILKDCTCEEEMWLAVAKTYAEKTELSTEQVLEIGRLLWIRRMEEEGLWNPPNLELSETET